MLNVKLSDKPCVFCGAKTDTAVVKSKEHDFQGVVCGKHLFDVLRKWAHATTDAKAGA